MELQVPYSFCTEISQTNHLRENKSGYRKNTEMRKLCENKGVEIIEAEVSIPPKYRVSQFGIS